MDNINFPKGFKVYLPLLTLFLLLVFIMPRDPKFHYDYKKGSPWMYETLVTQFDFPVLKTAQQLQEERERAGSTVIPYYKLDTKVAVVAENSLSEINLEAYPNLKSRLSESLATIYSRGVLAPGTGADEARLSSAGLMYVQRNRRASKVPVAEVFTVETALEYLKNVVEEVSPKAAADTLFGSVALSNLVVPNLMFDQQTTDLVHEENVDFISPTSGIVRTGNVIVSHGEIVTAEVEQLLDSYKAEYDLSLGYTDGSLKLILGHIIFVLVILALIYVTVYFVDIDMFKRANQFAFIIFLVVLFQNLVKKDILLIKV